MTERIPLAWWERALAFLAFHLCMALPGGWRGEPWRSVELWLLPHAASWAYPWKRAYPVFTHDHQI